MNPTVFLAVVISILGLAIGSFLNVVIYRVPRKESVVSPPSHCPRCDALIKTRHNVPVLGWLMLRGRCFGCALPISARYPLVEAATGVAFALITVAVGLSLALPVLLFLATVTITRTMIAFDRYRNRTTVPEAPATAPAAGVVPPA